MAEDQTCYYISPTCFFVFNLPNAWHWKNEKQQICTYYLGKRSWHHITNIHRPWCTYTGINYPSLVCPSFSTPAVVVRQFPVLHFQSPHLYDRLTCRGLALLLGDIAGMWISRLKATVNASGLFYSLACGWQVDFLTLWNLWIRA